MATSPASRPSSEVDPSLAACGRVGELTSAPPSWAAAWPCRRHLYGSSGASIDTWSSGGWRTWTWASRHGSWGMASCTTVTPASRTGSARASPTSPCAERASWRTRSAPCERTTPRASGGSGNAGPKGAPQEDLGRGVGPLREQEGECGGGARVPPLKAGPQRGVVRPPVRAAVALGE